MRNPYIDAAVRAAEHVRDQAPPVTREIKPISPTINRFFESLEIGHRGNRAKVATAIAHTMTREELEETIRRLEADRDERIEEVRKYNMPALLENAHKLNKAPLDILRRVLGKRG